jgi:hypothetical protein
MFGKKRSGRITPKRNSKIRVSKRGGGNESTSLGSATAPAPKGGVWGTGAVVSPPVSQLVASSGSDVQRPAAAATPPQEPSNVVAHHAAVAAHEVAAEQQRINKQKREAAAQEAATAAQAAANRAQVEAAAAEDSKRFGVEQNCRKKCGNDTDCLANQEICYTSTCKNVEGVKCSPVLGMVSSTEGIPLTTDLSDLAGQPSAETQQLLAAAQSASSPGTAAPAAALQSCDDLCNTALNCRINKKYCNENCSKKCPSATELDIQLANLSGEFKEADAKQPAQPGATRQVSELTERSGPAQILGLPEDLELQSPSQKSRVERLNIGSAEKGQRKMATAAEEKVALMEDSLRGARRGVMDSEVARDMASEAIGKSLSKKNLGNIILIRDDKEVDVYGGAQIVQTDEKNAVLIVNTTGLQEGGGLMDSLKNFGKKIKGAVSSTKAKVLEPRREQKLTGTSPARSAVSSAGRFASLKTLGRKTSFNVELNSETLAEVYKIRLVPKGIESIKKCTYEDISDLTIKDNKSCDLCTKSANVVNVAKANKNKWPCYVYAIKVATNQLIIETEGRSGMAGRAVSDAASATGVAIRSGAQHAAAGVVSAAKATKGAVLGRVNALGQKVSDLRTAYDTKMNEWKAERDAKKKQKLEQDLEKKRDALRNAERLLEEAQKAVAGEVVRVEQQLGMRGSNPDAIAASTTIIAEAGKDAAAAASTQSAVRRLQEQNPDVQYAAVGGGLFDLQRGRITNFAPSEAKTYWLIAAADSTSADNDNRKNTEKLLEALKDVKENLLPQNHFWLNTGCFESGNKCYLASSKRFPNSPKAKVTEVMVNANKANIDSAISSKELVPLVQGVNLGPYDVVMSENEKWILVKGKLATSFSENHLGWSQASGDKMLELTAADKDMSRFSDQTLFASPVMNQASVRNAEAAHQAALGNLSGLLKQEKVAQQTAELSRGAAQSLGSTEKCYSLSAQAKQLRETAKATGVSKEVLQNQINDLANQCNDTGVCEWKRPGMFALTKKCVPKKQSGGRKRSGPKRDNKSKKNNQPKRNNRRATRNKRSGRK